MTRQNNNIPAVLLVGGLGTRLRSVLPSTPKSLARLGNIPFLELLVLQLRSHGFRRVVMCTGHLAEQVEKEFGDGRKWELEIEYSYESKPLGTAGALKHADHLLGNADKFLVMNGDSFLEFDYAGLLAFHCQHGGIASLAVRQVPDASRYGSVQVDSQQRVVAFVEKSNSGAAGLVNGGVYLFNRSALAHLPEGPASLEREVFPTLLKYGVYAAEYDGMFIDIGTPADYARAQELCDKLRQAALAAQSCPQGALKSN